MVSPARLSGFNMSFFMNPTAAKEIASEKLEPIDNKKNAVKKDLVQEYLTSKTLQEHPEVIPQILNEMNLHKFWKQITTDPDVQVFVDLANDRMLNFYDASVKGSLTFRESRIGMIVAILTSSYSCTTVKYGATLAMKNTSSVIPCFMHENCIDIEKYKVKGLEDSAAEEVKRLVKLFSRSVPTRQKLAGKILDVYLTEAFKMWVVSKNPEVIKFMMSRDRFNYVTRESVYAHLSRHRHNLGYCDSTMVQSAVELSIFNTVWGRTRSWDLSFQSKMNSLLTGD